MREKQAFHHGLANGQSRPRAVIHAGEKGSDDCQDSAAGLRPVERRFNAFGIEATQTILGLELLALGDFPLVASKVGVTDLEVPMPEAFLSLIVTMLPAFRSIEQRLDRETGRRFNVFDTLFPMDERATSRILEFLLDPTEAHGQNDVFLREFIRQFEAYPVDSGSPTFSVFSGGNRAATRSPFDGRCPFACPIPEGLL